MLTPSVRRSPLVVLPVLIALILILTAPHAQADAPAVVSTGDSLTLPGRAVALTSGDFDGDGVPDLITIAADGSIEFRRGNVDSIFPTGEAALPFFPPTRLFLLPQHPDWLFAGDFDADSQLDLVTARRGDKSLTFLFGDGRGEFPRTRSIKLSESVTTLAVGHINRLDTLPDILIGTPSSVLIYEGAAGAANANPETIEVDQAVTAMAFGQFDDHFALDFAVGTGNDLLIVHGRDRKLTLDEAQRASVAAPQLDRYPQASPIVALASGNFVAEKNYTVEIAVLHSDGTLGIVNRSGLETAAFDLSWQASLTLDTHSRLRMIRLKTSSLPTDDLIVIDPLSKQLRLITTSTQDAPKTNVRSELKSQPLSAADPIAVLPMRLNRDALDDVVIAQVDGSLSVIPTRPAASYVVENIADHADMVDCNPGNGVCEPGFWQGDPAVCVPTGAGCTLRAALQDANAHTGADEILFGYVVNPIQPVAALPSINDPLTIDGSTTSGGTHVELVGTNAGAGVNGLNIYTDNSVVRGMVINRFQASGHVNGFGVSVSGTGNYVENNRLGTDMTGQVARGNGNGGVVIASGASLNTIGGIISTTRNIISGNTGHGLQIGEPGGGASSNTVQNNYIGLDADGADEEGNQEVGVIVGEGSLNNMIGGGGSAGRNVIGGNWQVGVGIQDSAQGTLVAGNYVGLDATGTLDRGNWLGGVVIVNASYNQIGYTAPADRNLVAANDEVQVGLSYAPTVLTASADRLALTGFQLYQTGSDLPSNPAGPLAPDQTAHNNVQNNRIGVKFGNAPQFGDQYPGVAIRNATSTTIGGAEANTGNLISRNQIGVLIYSADGGTASGNVIQGNQIGTDMTGSKSDEDDTPFNGNDWGNVLAGVVLENAANTQLGGNTEAARNVIAGSYGYGVWISGTQATGNVLHRNAIGTTITGTQLAHGVGTGLAGVWIDGGSQSVIGGSDVTSNTIGYSLGRGIVVASGTRNDLRYNRIFANKGVPIDLGDDGVTPNDDGDPDVGANNLQNTPVITQVVGKVITGTYNSFTNTAYSLEFYSYPVCEPMPGGHLADTYLLTKTVTTNVSGTATFNVTLPNAVPNGHFVSTTATDPQGNTSEFSNLPIVLRVSSSNFIPTSVFTPGHTLLAYTDVDPYLAATLATCLTQFQLFIAQDGNVANGVYLDDSGTGTWWWSDADFNSSDLHRSAWYTPTGSTTTTLELYITQNNDLQNTVLLDRVTLKPLPQPELIVLTDFRALFDEFNLTQTNSAITDTNHNRTLDYYEAIERMRKYGADHAGAIIDVRQDAYGPADFKYAANANRPQMYPAIDQLVGFVPTSSLKYVAVIGDDAVLPFYRYPDPEAQDECKYFATITCTVPINHGVPAMIDTQANFILSDVPYSTHIVTATSTPLADWGLGRIFARSPLSLTAMIDGYEQPLITGPRTGSAFTFNIKNEKDITGTVTFDWQANSQTFVDQLTASGYVTLTNMLADRGKPFRRAWKDEEAGRRWIPGNVAYAIEEPADGPRLTLLNTHANHWYNTTPTTTNFYAGFIDGRPPFPGSVFINIGCHAGYSTGYDTNAANNYYTPALVRAVLDRNITYHASTTYGNTTAGADMRFNDQVHFNFLQYLIGGAQPTVGEVRRDAQRDYYIPHPANTFEDRDIIGLYGTELYGLPTQPIRRQPAPVAVMALHQLAPTSIDAASAITINFAAPNFRVTFDYQNRALFEVPNGGQLTALDNGPVVPVLARSIYLPAGSTNVQVTWIASTTTPYGGGFTLQPQTAGDRTFGVSEVPYTLTAPYPATPYWINTYADAHGVRVVISVVPLRWDPVSGQVTLINSADFQIDFDAPPAAGTSINAISINDGNLVAINQLARSISATITADTAQPLALRWHIANVSDAPLVGEYSVFTPTLGGNVLTWQFDTLGWQPGPKVLHVQIEDASGVVIATAQQTFTVDGHALQLDIDQSIYDTGDSQAIIHADVRDANGAAVTGLGGSFAQTLDGNSQTLTWQAGDGYTATLNLAALSAGTHTLDVTVNGVHASVDFAIDRAAPTSTADSVPVCTSPSFTVTLSGDDDASGIKEYVVEYRVGSGGSWTHWLTQTTQWDYEVGAAPDLTLIFGPAQPVGLVKETEYFFRVHALDYSGNIETIHAAPDTSTIYRPRPTVYLPLIARGGTATPEPNRFVSRAGTDNGTCASPQTPCQTLQYAVDHAQANDVIAIAGYEAAYTFERPSGSKLLTYYETSLHAKPDGYYGPSEIRQIVYLDKSLTLRGGYSADFATRDVAKYKTVLRPGLDGFEGRAIVVPPFVSAVIDGLYLMEGEASGLGGEYNPYYSYNDAGGALYAQGAPQGGDTLTVRDCIIAGNVASRYTRDGSGGGVYIDARHDAVFTGNRVYHNYATISSYGATGLGGGVFVRYSNRVQITHNAIYSNTGGTENSAEGGGLLVFGLNNMAISDNAVTDNVGTEVGPQGLGGGIYVWSTSGGVIANNVISGNVANLGGTAGSGGGLSLYRAANLTVSANWILDNVAAPLDVTTEGSSGGGVRVSTTSTGITFVNNVVARNRAPFGGSGFTFIANASDQSVQATLLHNTLAANGLPTMLRRAIDRSARSTRLPMDDLELITAPDRSSSPDRPAAIPKEAQGIHVAGYVTLNGYNTIVSGHTRGVYEYDATRSDVALDYTLWFGNTTNVDATVTHTHDIFGNPAYTSDYHIGSTSAAKDAGGNFGVTTDIDGQARPFGAGYDLGADEYR